MHISEITDEDKTFLKLSDIEYDFRVDAAEILKTYQKAGNNPGKRTNLKNKIEHKLLKINKFLNLGFDKNDPDIEFAKEIYNELAEIRDQL